jgi:hypothetical protein
MKKFLPLILTILMFSGLFTACESGVISNSEPLPLETFENTTLTTAANGEREEIANTENDEIGDTGEVVDPETLAIPEGITNTLISDRYLVYYTDVTKGDSRFNEIVALDREENRLIDVFASQVNLSVKPGDEYFSGQTFLTDDFYFGEDGLLYLTMLTDYNTDSFHKKLFYSKDLETGLSYELGSETSDTPYPEYVPTERTEEVVDASAAVYNMTDTEYMAAANSVFYGQFAFDDQYIYYENLNDNHNLYKKRFDSDDAGVKLAEANVYGHIYGICVYGDEVFYVTKYYDPKTATGTDGGGSTAYAVKKDGSSTEPRVVIEGVGDYFYVYDGNIYYTGGISSKNEAQLLSMPVDGGTPEKIADFAMHMSIADGMITYYDGVNIHVYDIASKSVTTTIAEDSYSLDSMFRYGDYIIYHYEYGAESRLYSNLSAINIKDRTEKQIAVTMLERNEEVAGGTIMPMSYNIFEGNLYYNTFTDERDDGYYDKITYGYNLTEKRVGFEGLNEGRAPYLTNPPECVMFSTPYGLYTYASDGKLEKYIFPSL